MDKRFIKRVRLNDRIATRVITVGGMIIIASVIAILLLIVKVALPLFMPSKATFNHQLPIAYDKQAQPIAVGIDDYKDTAYTLESSGVFTFFRVKDGKTIFSKQIRENGEVAVKSYDRHHNASYTILWEDLQASLVKVAFKLEYDQQGKRIVKPAIQVEETIPPLSLQVAPIHTQIRKSEEGRLTRVDLLSDNRFSVVHQVTTTDLFDNQVTERFSFMIVEEIPGNITAFTLSDQGTALFAGTDNGSLLRWDLSENEAYHRSDNIRANNENTPITALAMVLGDVSLAVGDKKGNLSTWMPIRTESQSNTKKLRKIHTLADQNSPILDIKPSLRNKTIISLNKKGVVNYDHVTSENHLFEIDKSLALMSVSDRGNTLIGVDKNGNRLVWDVDNPHPEINFKTLFGKVWYENYNQPEFVWQSSSGSDDFEPKFSIIPLLFGTIKGTLYAMIFAIPLAIFGAVYTSQFTTRAFKKTVKPAIEIMASVPSVVIGFLIALWLAPIVENAILSILLSIIFVPLVFIGFLFIYKPLYNNNLVRELSKGYEFLLLVPVIFFAALIVIYLGPVVENSLFNGNFTRWLFNDLGMRYDQRNCIIIAFGLGIAVIPIIFSITEDAISNIPPSLSAASLALGASRWQTVWRVVMPSASPGIFAAIMIGFGRAVGETMIVLMATGNTPILDWSIFNGMRTLSANIAVEIPEAPFGGTLYRVLFLCATLLFGLTFILNTGAEIIREKLRKKYVRY